MLFVDNGISNEAYLLLSEIIYFSIIYAIDCYYKHINEHKSKLYVSSFHGLKRIEKCNTVSHIVTFLGDFKFSTNKKTWSDAMKDCNKVSRKYDFKIIFSY